MNNFTIAAITFSASGLMHLSMATGEKISLHEHEGARFSEYVYGESSPTIIKEELLLEGLKFRHQNRYRKMQKPPAVGDMMLYGFYKDFRRKKNAMARRNDDKKRNRNIF